MPDTDPDEVLHQVERAISARFGGQPARASVSFVGVEPMAVLRFGEARTVSLLTLGMSRRPMGDEGADPRGQGPRAELLAMVRGDGGDLWRRLAMLAAAPAVEGVVYVDGMSVDVGMALDGSSRCTGGLVVASDWPTVPTVAGDVTIFRFLPATSTELAYSRVHGSAALRERWRSAGTDLLDLARAAVDLS